MIGSNVKPKGQPQKLKKEEKWWHFSNKNILATLHAEEETFVERARSASKYVDQLPSTRSWVPFVSAYLGPLPLDAVPRLRRSSPLPAFHRQAPPHPILATTRPNQVRLACSPSASVECI